MGKRLPFIILIFFIGQMVFAQQNEKRGYTQFLKGSKHPPNFKEIFDKKSGYFLTTFQVPGKSIIKNNRNIEEIRKLDDTTSIVYISGNLPDSLLHFTSIIGEANDEWKYTPGLINYLKHSARDRKNQFLVKVREFTSSKDKWKNNKFIDIVDSYEITNTLVISSTAKYLADNVITDEGVVFASLYTANPKEESSVLDLNLNVNTINTVHNNYPTYNGDGVTISIKEQSFDPLDIDLRGRVVLSSISSTSVSRHATEMATIAGGAGNTSPNSLGAAWGATFSSADFSNLFPDSESYYASQNINLQNHAYGTIIENFYGALAEAYDTHTYKNRKILHVFSVGNNGPGTDTTGTYKGVSGYANLTGNFKMAKNIITAGAVDTTFGIDPFVSRGPAYDGRLKPEVSAYSTSGSSSSAALVSGLVAIMQDFSRDQYGQSPDAALIKAILMNSADDIGPAGIDFRSGYGNVNADRAMSTLNNGDYFSGTVTGQASSTFALDVPPNAVNLKILIAWNDPPGNVNDNKALVNDLDLTVKNSGITWLPWVLNSYPHIDSLQLLPTRKIDRLNNMEQVTIEKPVAGNYELHIEGFDVTGSQDFYLVYQWDLANSFQWTYPTASDNVPYNGDATTYLRWKNTFEGMSGVLEYSVDDGREWLSINDNVDLALGYYRWRVPDLFSTALIRMKVGTQQYISAPFTISRPLTPRVGFNCPDSLLLSWQDFPHAQDYALFVIGGKYMEPLLTTADTTVILNKQNLPYSLFAVGPRLPNGKSGIRSLTFDYRLQGVDCYISSFLAIENQEESVVDLKLTVGTIYRIDKIIFERQEQGEFMELGVVNRPAGTSIQFADSSPLQGLNTYRARLVFENDTEIITDPAPVYFLTELPALIFPNPLNKNEELNVFTRNFNRNDIHFKLVNSSGQTVLKTNLLSEREVISVTHLRAGLYLFSINGGGVSYSGRLVIF